MIDSSDKILDYDNLKARDYTANLPAKCHKCKSSVGVVNIGGNILLVIVKAYLGIIGGSKGLFADAIHSLGDLVASFMMVIAVSVSGRSKSKKYQYGQGKFEFAIAVVIYVSLIVVGLYIMYDGIHSLYVGRCDAPNIVTAWGALISILANEIMYRQGLCVSDLFMNPSIKAKAIESRVDVYSSIAVLVGILGARSGLFLLDSLAAIAVAVLILKSAIKELISSITALMDRSLEKDVVDKIKESILKISTVKKIGKLRSRDIGSRAEVEVEVFVDKDVFVEKFSEIKTQVNRVVMLVIDCECDVNVQIKQFKETGK